MRNKEKAGWLLLFAALGAFWRRWFGGGFKSWLPDSRFWKYLVLTVTVFAMYWSLSLLDWTSVRMYLVALSFSYHWSRSHGDYYYVWDTGKDEGRIWWIDQVLRLIYGEDSYYNFKGNCTGLFLRYTSTACIVAVCLPNALFIASGLLTTLSYMVTSKMSKPTDKAEWLAGALNFGLLYISLCL